MRTNQPILIAHRGASGYLPEHTLAAYALAALQGADFLEPDLVMSRDGVLLARHDNQLDLTTDVADHPEFADRHCQRRVDGQLVSGWFSEDFTLAELKTLRAVERIPQLRPANRRFDRMFDIPTFAEVIALAKGLSQASGRPIGLYPETKHPSHFAALGLSMEAPLVAALHGAGYRSAADPVFIQSFEVGNLRQLRGMTDLKLVQLLAESGQPFDVVTAGGTLDYEQMATAAGLTAIAGYADGVGPQKSHFILAADAEGRLDPARASGFIDEAHAVGLLVHPYTFRAENHFLPPALRGSSTEGLGDLVAELRLFLALGIDGFFCDQPDLGRRAIDLIE